MIVNIQGLSIDEKGVSFNAPNQIPDIARKMEGFEYLFGSIPGLWGLGQFRNREGALLEPFRKWVKLGLNGMSELWVIGPGGITPYRIYLPNVVSPKTRIRLHLK